MPVRKKRQPSPVGSRVGPYGKPGRTVGMRRPRRPRRSLADAVFPIPAPNIELVGADGRKTRPYAASAFPIPLLESRLGRHLAETLDGVVAIGRVEHARQVDLLLLR